MNKSTFRPNLNGFLRFFFLAALPFLLAQTTGPKVTKIEIKHVGPPATSDSLIRSNIRVKEGDVYQRARVDDDVRSLYATGYFYNVRVADEPSADGVVLTYVVQGNPTLMDIKFSGNRRYGNHRLQKKLTSKVGQPLDEKKLFKDAKELEKMYQKVGYQRTTVKPVLSIDENAGRGSVTFEVKETGKVKIREIVFEGANSFPQKKLRKQLKTKRRWWMSWLTGSGVLKDEQFEDDKEKLTDFYHSEGFIDFEIKDVKFDYATPNVMVIRFVLEEGQRYKVGAVEYTGNKLFPTEEITRGYFLSGKLIRPRMEVGDTFTPQGLTKDVNAISDFYGSKGYIDTKVNAVKKPNTTTGTMDLVYQIEEGTKSFIERIDIKGNDKTKDRVIRRELAVSPGEVFDMTRVKLSKERLEGLNYFEKVDTRSEDTDVPNRKNLVVGLEEKNTGSFTVGAGLSSVDSVVGFVEVSQSNFDLFKPPTFTGAGQKFRLRMQLGTKRADYQLSWVEPWFLGRKLAFGVDLFHRDYDFVSRDDLYKETHTGGSMSLTRALGSESLIGKVSYTLEHTSIHLNSGAVTNTGGILVTNNGTPVFVPLVDPLAPPTISPSLASEGGGRLASSFGTSLAYDTRNNALLPSRGQRSELVGELAGLGGDVNYYKLEAKTAWYFPGFWEGHIVEVVGRLGVVDDYGSGDRGTHRVPLFDRWFLGGLYSLRGYRYREVGPRDFLGFNKNTGQPVFGEPIGGETYAFASAEYSLPIIERVRLAFFYDIGNVYPNAYSFGRGLGQQKLLQDDVGIGIRLNLPIGPLRLDYGFPIQHDKNTSGSGRFQFGVGYTREF
jgi:outer membrane protein insertion porin family